MFDNSYYWWAFWLGVLFLGPELYGAFFTKGKPDTFSEFVWWTFNTRPKRALVAVFMSSLTMHFVFEWSAVPLLVLGAPIGAIVLRRMRKETMNPQYSFTKGASKVLGSIFEIGAAAVLALSPQLLELVLDFLSSTPPDVLHVPPEWTAFWIVAIRGLRNWWKNRK